MNKLKHAVKEVLKQQRALLGPKSFEYLRASLLNMLDIAKVTGADAPSQELFDEYLKRNSDHFYKFSRAKHSAKLIDAYSNIHALRSDGQYFNEPNLPLDDEAKSYFCDVVYPIKSVDMGYLIVKSKLELEKFEPAGATLKAYVHEWKELWCWFLAQGLSDYDEDKVRAYIDLGRQHYADGKIHKGRYDILRKSCQVLIEVARTGTYKWKTVQRNKFLLVPEDLEWLHQRYLDHLRANDLRKSTIKHYDFTFKKMVVLGNIQRIDDIASLNYESVADITKKLCGTLSSNTLRTVIPDYRHILYWFYTEGYTSTDLSESVMVPKNHSKNVAAYITSKDEEKILECITDEPLRNQAMILMFMRYGIRNCDVCNLKLTDIDWKHDKISIIQEKTGQPLILPLLADVGNAIWDYINNERPSTSCPYVFLRLNAPHTRLTTVSTTISRIVKKAGVTSKNRIMYGPHLFRYSLAKDMLDHKVPRQIISDTLGHTSAESTKQYLTIDESGLRKCALECPAKSGDEAW